MAVNCCVVPFGIDGLAGVIAIDARTAGPTVKVVLPETPPKEALTWQAPGAPHELLLVLDATTGMNALNQAREFNKAVPLTGLVITKLDGTSKGGMVVAIQKELGLPIKFIGVGEQPDDLQPFDAKQFAAALFEE